MTSLAWLADRLPPWDPPEPPRPGRCCVTGEEGPTIARAWAVKPTSTDLDWLAAPESDRVSVAAWRVLTDPVLRRRSWLATPQGVVMLDRDALRAQIFAPLEEPWMGYVTTSGHRHGVLRTPLNRDGRRRWLWELVVVDLTDVATMRMWWDRLQAIWATGHVARAELLTLEPALRTVRRVGLAPWVAFANWARGIRHDPRYAFLVWLLPARARAAVVSTTGSTEDADNAEGERT